MKHDRQARAPGPMPIPPWSRRQFVQRAALGGGAMALGAIPVPGRGAAPPQVPAASSEAFTAKAVYMNPLISVTNDDFLYLVNMINQTELNALVVDVKEVRVYVNSSVDLFRATNTVSPVLDAPGLLRTLDADDIYAIARLVVFKDSAIASARPDLAVLDTETGAPWVDYGDGLWLNPLNEEVWEAIASYAVELAELGFDEIQFDYVRFPSDGDLSTTDYGQDVDERIRADALVGFLGYCRERLAPFDIATAADVFGYTYLLDDIGIGQDAGRIAEVVDVVCPMTYPSHYPDGSMDVAGHPNDFPYETIAQTLEIGSTRVPASRSRPWIQDFSLPGMREYGAEDVRAQIAACDDAGTAGWMVWDPNNVYHADGFVTTA
ncbi:MAG: twin-arginine translocation signal domain-containing protein [Chloroflexota bacterium]|nr:twin-arginine translocation signal domain-containing protein [Chloroflexota bacterium]